MAIINTFSLFILFVLPVLLSIIIAIGISEWHGTKQTAKILQAEIELQHTYYKTVKEIQSLLRQLRHDLANHLNVMNTLQKKNDLALLKQYENALLERCHNIDLQIVNNTKWHRFRATGLSDKESYIIFSYLNQILLYTEQHWQDVDIHVQQEIFQVAIPKKKRRFKEKRYMMKSSYFHLVKKVVHARHGRVTWKEEGKQWRFILTY